MSKLPRHVHLIGVGGVGMASLAGLFKQKGLKVTGSDTGVYPPMSDMLRETGVEIREGYCPENLKDSPGMVIVGNAISRDNPEAAELLRLGIPYMSMPQALWEFFLKDKERIVVAGTHGKTTTSSLISWILYSSGLDPSFLIGGMPRNFGRGFRLGNGRHFIVEGDEYDTAFFDKGPKFLHYQGQRCVLTAVEFDHADIYRDLNHVKESFRKYVCAIPKDGFLTVSADYPHAVEVSEVAVCRVETYGLNPESSWHLKDGKIVHEGKELGDWAPSSSLMGRHNFMNALGAVSLAFNLGLGIKEILQGLKTFEGVRRRQELVGEAGGVTIVDDFAHHPTAIREGIAALREKYPGQRLWAVFEPRSNTSRRNIFQKEISEALARADAIVIGGVFNPQRIDPEKRFSPEKASEVIRAAGKEAAAIESIEGILGHLLNHLKEGDVVLFMSNGPFGGLPSLLLKELSKKQ